LREARGAGGGGICCGVSGCGIPGGASTKILRRKIPPAHAKPFAGMVIVVPNRLQIYKYSGSVQHISNKIFNFSDIRNKISIFLNSININHDE
jgi:hypothetical protein